MILGSHNLQSTLIIDALFLNDLIKKLVEYVLHSVHVYITARRERFIFWYAKADLHLAIGSQKQHHFIYFGLESVYICKAFRDSYIEFMCSTIVRRLCPIALGCVVSDGAKLKVVNNVPNRLSPKLQDESRWSLFSLQKYLTANTMFVPAQRQ